MAPDWGSVPEWVGAVSTAGALIATAILLRTQMKDRAKETASRITAWTEHDQAGDWQFLFRNNDDTPIHQCLASFGDPLGEPGVGHFFYELIPPQTTKEWKIEGLLPVACMAEPLIEIRFTDSREKHWRRDTTGRLHQEKHPACDPDDERNAEAVKRLGILTGRR